ncbi:YaaA family protein [Nitratiruptor sp. YY09-18]|uniref:YaaA family protein n=1 Tax=Nitratiruptor sp. YY09-18 TaxID=2724901 RepID=UPI001915E4D2|nr:YaaA family protein [Nitratiruptor sp. YY09-18]BCD68444.1 hypothetical protein NitYY0918_C1359 [Nitratiruptor sp. YY09-18]
MHILFAPSEAKIQGGYESKIQFCFDIERRPILQKYDDVIKNGTLEEKLKLFGTKEPVEVDIFNSPTKKAIERYHGVAYEYLDYASLHPLHQEFIDNHLIIFSNLFGPLCARDLIPFYKLKQGEAVGGIKPEKFYAPLCKNLHLDSEILDLRAGYYEKFYKPAFAVKMKFIKNGKVVSHWAKAYRGMVLRQIAIHNIDSFKKLRDFTFEGLRLKEIISKKNEEIWVMEII